MVFKKLLGAMGAGGPSVDTVLDGGAVAPGGILSGQVHLQGGGTDVEIEHIGLDLIARVEAEHEDGESEGAAVFDRFTVGGGFRLAAEERRSVPFRVALPWETPVTELYGQPLGIVLGVRTELAVAGARDKGTSIRSRYGRCPSRRRCWRHWDNWASASGRPTSSTATSGARASSCPSTRRSS